MRQFFHRYWLPVINTPAATAHVLEGGWDRGRFWGRQLRGKSLGVIGHGRIGAMVARYAASFGMDVIACDRIASKIGPPAKPVSFDELLRHADVVSVHVTATPENRNLIDRAAIARLKRGAILVAPATDPSWTPLFTLASGVIVEVGGILSHASTVAREYGLPALANVKDATRWLSTGDRVRLDASGGFVVRLGV